AEDKDKKKADPDRIPARERLAAGAKVPKWAMDDLDAYVYNLKTTHYERKEKKAAGGGKSSHDKIKDYFVMVTELDLPEASFTDFEKFKDPEFDPDDVAEADCYKFRKAFPTAAIPKH